MSGKQINTGNELPIDLMLQTAASELPPPEITVDQITPWEKAIKQILFGLALTTIIPDINLVNFLLPLCGQLLLLLGFRTLRSENRHFKTGYWFVIAELVIRFITLILNTTFWSSLDPLAQYLPILSYCMIILTIGTVICLRNGLVAVQRKAGIPADDGNATALIVWYTGLNLSALLVSAVQAHIGTFQNNILITIACFILMIIYACILFSFYRQSIALLDVSGYVIEPAPVKISSKQLCLGLCSLLLALMAIGYLFFNQYPMKWTAIDPFEHTEVESIKEDLRMLGFPNELLDTMTTEDILACAGAKSIASSSNDEHTVNEVHMLTSTTVAVQLAEERQWKFFYYFEWLVDPNIYRADALCIHPAYTDEEYFLPVGELTGRLLYDREGTTYTADYYRIAPSLYERFGFNPVFGTDWFATFSLPVIGENYRGYLSYEAELNNYHFNINTWAYYFHPKDWLQYPVIPVDSSRVTTSLFHFIDHFDLLHVGGPE